MTQGAQRRRGVQASRARLSRALAEAGLKTQAALADRIADLEDLDSPPRDMVSRAFRELAVETTSIERIALALKVPAHTLYKTSDESEALSVAAKEAPARMHRPALMWSLAAGSAMVVSVLAGWLWVGAGDATRDQGATQGTAPLSLGRLHVVVLPLTDDTDGLLTPRLRAALAGRFNVATPTAGWIAGDDLRSVADKLRADLVVEGELVTAGRLVGVRAFVFQQGVRRQFWAESLPRVAFADRVDDVARRLAAALEHSITSPAASGIAHFPLAPVQDEYLAGEKLLDAPANELNLKRAQSRFQAALRQDSNYAPAHAGLCEALLEEHWMLEEDRMLLDAQRACSQALLLNPDHPAVIVAHAHFLTRTGRNDEAITRYELLTEREPLNASAWEGLGAARLDAYRQSGDTSYLELAKQASARAGEVDPYVWKPYFYLASMEYFSGDLDAAISASERALTRDENEFLLANLGTFYMCSGDFFQAKSRYARARELAPESYVGDEFLGSAHYFLGEFAESAALRRRAIERLGEGAPEIHEMWGNLGDALRHSGDTADAIAAYLRAAEIAERDHLRGTAPAADRAARAYYYTVLHALDPVHMDAEVERAIGDTLDEIEASLSEATAHRRMAQIWLMRGEPDRARAALARSVAACPGYAALPDLAVLSG